MNRRAAFVSLLAVVLIGAVIWLTWSDSQANEFVDGRGKNRAVTDEGFAVTPVPVSREPRAGRGTQPRREHAAGSDFIEFVDATSGEGIPGVVVLESKGQSAWLEISPESTIAKADESGRIERDRFEKVNAELVASAPGYLSLVLDAAAHKVPMRRALTTKVYCVGSGGRPIPGCNVFVARRRRGRPPVLDANAVGYPGAENAAWFAKSDAHGVATLEGIPPGAWRLHVYSAAWFPLARRFQGAVDLDLPIERISVPLAPILGAVCALPLGVGPEVRMLAYKARWNSGFSRAPMGTRRMAEELLRRDHPKAAVFFARGALGPGQAIGSVEVEMVLSNGARCTGMADMVPIGDVKPVRLTVREMLAVRPVRLDVKENEHRRLRFGLGRAGLGRGLMVIPIISGVVTKVPCGSYEIVTPGMIVPGSRRWKPKQIEIPEGKGVLPIALDIGGPARMLRIQSTFADPACAEPIWLSVSHSNGDSTSFAPQALLRGSVEVLLPYGKIRVRAATVEDGAVSKKLVVNANTANPVHLVIPAKPSRPR